jgi:hypothetical protein
MKPCSICGELTSYIEINYGDYYCSDECVKREDEGFFEALNK